MRLSEQVKPISYFKDNAAKTIAEMTETHEPLIITQNGEATCVIQDIKSYEDTKKR
jgi:prevent-host-death family protein